MTSVQQSGHPPATDAHVPGTLRAHLSQYSQNGLRPDIKEVVSIVVPLCVEAAEVHEQGYGLLLHPSAVVQNPDGSFSISSKQTADTPILPSDKACVAPEVKSGELGDARATVYAIGAIFYELLTGLTVGPGMKRPSDVVPDLDDGIEAILGKALITTPAHRPDDLKALAQAIHHFAPRGTVPPPPAADESHLDSIGDLAVDVSLSLLPPAPAASPTHEAPIQVSLPRPPGLGAPAAAAPAAPGTDDATAKLAALKARLEADRTPRWVVVKEGMDHGPFAAVELLQQITGNTFVEDDVLRDNKTDELKTIKEWEDFAPFAEHARRHRNIAEEKEAIVRVVAMESKRTRGKAVAAGAILALLLAGIGTWYLTQRGSRSDMVAIQEEKATNVESEGNVNVKKRRRGGRRVVGRSGNIPILAGGMSCEAAQAAYVEEIKMGGGGQADITRGQYAGVMNNGSYLNGCGVPSSMGVNVCVAVQNGRAVGVTVVTKPRNAGVARCIAGRVRRISFPSHPKLDVVRTAFAPQ